MHARIEKSKRLQRLLSILQSGESFDTLYLSRETGSMALHTDIHELRAQGIPVSPAQYVGLSDKGRKVYKYSLDNKPSLQEA